MDINTLVINFMNQYGLISIFIIITLEYANFPLPSEVVLPLVGIMISKGDFNFLVVLIISILAGITGSITNYLIGLKFGKSLMKYLLKKYPKIKKSMNVSVWWLNKYGKVSVMISRVIPVARTFISIPAGINKMNMYSFICYSSIGIGVWNSGLIGLGYILGDNLSEIGYIMKNYSILIFILILIIIVTLFLRKDRYIKNNC
ncbi:MULTISPECIES: DedA family protein [unclassified Romboutsia]|uniref:DedA family protein n=1 Tax=unclassified Romboutsia TaxID=2626894 RepID=UPI000820A6B0|nr:MULTISPECIES: DedA family protein [unclassified Romboutsia]SCH93664.1 SNARE associated Golgi protein [uncultured Clostridium sp.]